MSNEVRVTTLQIVGTFHAPPDRPRRRSRPRCRLGGLSSRARTSRRMIWFMVIMGTQKHQRASHKPPCSAGCQPVVFGRGFALSAQPHFLSLSSSKKEERAGERRRFLSITPLSGSLPARSSQGERGKMPQAFYAPNTIGCQPAVSPTASRRRVETKLKLRALRMSSRLATSSVRQKICFERAATFSLPLLLTKGGEGWGEEALFINFPSLRLSPRSFLAGRERQNAASVLRAEHNWLATCETADWAVCAAIPMWSMVPMHGTKVVRALHDPQSRAGVPPAPVGEADGIPARALAHAGQARRLPYVGPLRFSIPRHHHC